ncbi:hypothetical protein EDD85DRAFT_961842 [Armillaria nabsnona]|nr:hypothetical protein EDD85DRAFT_961842 [Armillaria nabsnona]
MFHFNRKRQNCLPTRGNRGMKVRLDCTYIEFNKSAPSKSFGYVKRLEDKAEKMENVLHKILPLEAVLKEELEAVQIPPPWTSAGIALRIAHDAGAQRKKTTRNSPVRNTVEAEQWKRALWCLLGIDSTLGSALGRVCAIYGEDIEIDVPTECDDEYWIHLGAPTGLQATSQQTVNCVVLEFYLWHG